MELYTSLVRLKQQMNNGQLPPMTPLTADALLIVDPLLTINENGMGGLLEDAKLGLRCPVRGCGKWFHLLSKHVNKSHADIGGARGLRDVLSIPRNAPLASRSFVEHCVRTNAASRAAGKLALVPPRPISLLSTEDRLRHNTHAAKGGSRQRGLIGLANLKNACRAQLSQRLLDLAQNLGRSPTQSEFESKYGKALSARVGRTFGSFNNAKALLGLEIYARNRTPRFKVEARREAVLESLSAWYEKYHTLPSIRQARNRNRAPLIVDDYNIRVAMGTLQWSEAMRRAASLLNIYGGRYGLPIENKPKEDAA